MPGLPASRDTLSINLEKSAKCGMDTSKPSPFIKIYFKMYSGQILPMFLPYFACAIQGFYIFQIYPALFSLFRDFTPLKTPKCNLIFWNLDPAYFGWLPLTFCSPLFRFALSCTFWFLILTKFSNYPTSFCWLWFDNTYLHWTVTWCAELGDNNLTFLILRLSGCWLIQIDAGQTQTTESAVKQIKVAKFQD